MRLISTFCPICGSTDIIEEQENNWFCNKCGNIHSLTIKISDSEFTTKDESE